MTPASKPTPETPGLPSPDDVPPPPEAPHDLGLAPALKDASSAFAARIIDHFTSPKFTAPMLPAVALEVHSLAHKTNIDVAQVIAVLERDPLLAGRVLKVAQSAAYYAVGGVASLRDAVVRIGLRGLSDILWEVAFTSRVLRTPKYSLLTDTVIKHSTAIGHLVRTICNGLGINADSGFLCGLLHDAGTTACLSVLGSPPPGERQPPDQLVGPILKLCHEEATRILAALWKLPDEVQSVIGHHHTIGSGPIPAVLAALVVAEVMAAEIEPKLALATLGADPVDLDAYARSRETLRLTDERMAKIRPEAAKILAGLTAAPKPVMVTPPRSVPKVPKKATMSARKR
jgi:HD-like signal output (HDOD) protein